MLRRIQSGFSLVPALFLLVVLAALGIVAVRLAGVQHQTVVLAMQSGRAYAAARSGIDWSAYQALVNNSCAASTLSLTEAGETYFEQVKDIVQAVEEADLAVTQKRTDPSGTLRITTPSSLARRHISPAVSAFLTQYPKIRVVMKVTDRIVDVVEDGLDVALRAGRLDDSSLIARKIGEVRRVLCASPAYLERAGFETLVARDGQRGLELAHQRRPQFVILDLMLPGLDGWEVCRKLRRDSDVPILMLTAREEETDRVVGFSLGADDYVVKPFSPRELVERVKAILRRARAAEGAGEDMLQHAGLVLEPDKHKVTLDGETIALTPTEYTLLQTLIGAPGRVFTRAQLLGHIYRNGETVIDRVIDVHVGKLRQKLEADPAKPRFILTVHGIGYRFAEPDE